MTKRAIIIGMALAVVLCCITYFNQSVMRQTALVGSYLPMSVYGPLIVVILLLNPVLKRLRPEWRLEGREFAVILTLVLAACGIAESGFLKTFTNVLMLPHLHRKQNLGWDNERVFDRLPDHMLADPGENDEALAGFVQGKIHTAPMSLGDIPWDAWATPLVTWLPLVLLVMLAFIGLALVVHRQWSEHERLPYPIARFARSLWGSDPSRASGSSSTSNDKERGASVLAQRAFWIAAAVVLAIHMLNFAYIWWPRNAARIPTRFDFYPIARLFPTFARGRLAWVLSQLRIYFSVIGFAYLVSSEISFSFGIAPFIYTIFDGILVTYGISSMAGGEHRASIYTSLNLGSFVAFVAMVAYFGRRYYWTVLRSSIGFRAGSSTGSGRRRGPERSNGVAAWQGQPATGGQGVVLGRRRRRPDFAETPRPHEVWGMRVFLACSILATVLMVAYGLAWPFAIIYMLNIIIFYVAVSRVVAETGLFFMKPAWVAHIMLLGLFGGYALGPTAALIAMFFSAVLFAEARESVMPYVVNSLELLSRERVRLGRAAAWAAGAVTLGIVAGIVVMLFLQYDRGTDMAAGGWFTRTVPSYAFDISTDISQRLRRQGNLEESDALPSGRRLLAIRPERKFAISFVVGAALVVFCYLGRLRIRWWPIHPAVFLLWNWYHVSKLTFSFLVGWAIKAGVTKYAGWKMVQRLRPMMIGLIAGDMLGAFLPAMISALYYFLTGKLPQSFNIMP